MFNVVLQLYMKQISIILVTLYLFFVTQHSPCVLLRPFFLHVKFRKHFLFSHFLSSLKGIVHKNEISVIIYSSSSCTKPS